MTIVLFLQDYDADGDYVKTWIPELGNVPKEKVHAPFSMSKEEQSQSGVTIGRDYPYPPKSNYDRSGEGKSYGQNDDLIGRKLFDCHIFVSVCISIV